MDHSQMFAVRVFTKPDVPEAEAEFRLLAEYFGADDVAVTRSAEWELAAYFNDAALALKMNGVLGLMTGIPATFISNEEYVKEGA
jgi:hypothetical protein